MEWGGCVPSLLFDLRPNYGGGNEDKVDLLQKVQCKHCYTQCPGPCSRPWLTHTSARDSWTLTGKSGSVSCGVTALFPGSQYAQFCLCPPRVCFPSPVYILMALWWVKVTSSKRAYAMPSFPAPRTPAPTAVHCWPVPSGDTHTPFCLSLCGISGSWCAQGKFEPSEHLCWVWGLILTWFCPSYHFAGASLPLGMGYLLTAAQAPDSHCSIATWLWLHECQWICIISEDLSS